MRYKTKSWYMYLLAVLFKISDKQPYPFYTGDGSLPKPDLWAIIMTEMGLY